MTRIPEHKLGHWVAHDARAVARATIKQRQAWHRLRKRCTVKGAVLLSNGVLVIGFERLNGRDADAYVGRDGTRLATEHTQRRQYGRQR